MILYMFVYRPRAGTDNPCGKFFMVTQVVTSVIFVTFHHDMLNSKGNKDRINFFTSTRAGTRPEIIEFSHCLSQVRHS